ncbi:hypothetical protein B0H13DRAFT_2109653 [Mycena leptocephala]|nr:hypothetical protein B0H13DRAFT_2109653 [Mycena leptocephala]
MWMWMSTSTRAGALPVPRGAGEGSTVSGRISRRLKQWKQGRISRARSPFSPPVPSSVPASANSQGGNPFERLGEWLFFGVDFWLGGGQRGSWLIWDGFGAMRSGFAGVLVCGVVCDGASPRRVLDVSPLTCTRRAARRRPIGWCRYAETMRATSSISSFTVIILLVCPASPACRCRSPSFRLLHVGDPQFPFWDEDDFVALRSIFGRRSGAPLPLSIFIRSNSSIWSSPRLHFAFDVFPCHPSCPLSESHTLPLQCPPSVETSSLLTALLRKLFVQ